MRERTEAPRPRNAPESAGRYRYRNGPAQRGQGRSSAPTERLLRALAAHKQRLGHVRARIRALTAQRNVSLAQAVGSGLRISAAADILGESVPGIRRIALAVDEAPSAVRSRDEHVRALQTVRTELEAAASAKEAVERELHLLVAQAYALGFTDEAQLAALAGLPAESVRRSLRCRRRAE
ncbi:hypothetical protein ACVWWH_001639 [Sinomonas sp. RB5]